MGRIKRVAQGIDDVTKAVWDDSGLGMKLVILIVLVGTATAIPLIPLALVARYIANR